MCKCEVVEPARVMTSVKVILWLLTATIYSQNVADGWNSASDAQEELWTLFQEAERKAVVASIELSKFVQNTTKRLYKSADHAARLVTKIKGSLFTNSHSVMLHSVTASRCLEELQLSNIVKEMNNAVAPAKRCLHDFADIGASHEKEITRIIVQMRSYIMEAKRSLKFCQQTDETDVIYKPCFDTIVKEMKRLIEILSIRINSVKDDCISKNNRSNSIIRSCLRRLRKQIAKVKSIQKDVLKCKD